MALSFLVVMYDTTKNNDHGGLWFMLDWELGRQTEDVPMYLDRGSLRPANLSHRPNDVTHLPSAYEDEVQYRVVMLIYLYRLIFAAVLACS